MQGAKRLVVHNGLLGGTCGFPGAVRVDRDERVEDGLQAIGAAEDVVEELDRRQLTLANGLDQRGGLGEAEVRDGRRGAH